MIPEWKLDEFKSLYTQLSEEEFTSVLPDPVLLVFSELSKGRMGQLFDSLVFDISLQMGTFNDSTIHPDTTTTTIWVYQLKFNPAWEDPQIIRVGRHQGNELRLHNRNVSKLHAVIRKTVDGEFMIEDMGSTNGTTVSGTVLEPNVPHPLKDRQKIVFTNTMIGFIVFPESLYEMIHLE